jgi:hypothetical protein
VRLRLPPVDPRREATGGVRGRGRWSRGVYRDNCRREENDGQRDGANR